MTYEWQLVTDDITLTDDMGFPVIVTPAKKRANISYADTGEPAPRLRLRQTVYVDYREHDLLIGEDHLYVRDRPENYTLV